MRFARTATRTISANTNSSSVSPRSTIRLFLPFTNCRANFPNQTIRLIECPARLGANGKVSTLAQLALQARYEFLLVNDSDITVSPHYLDA